MALISFSESIQSTNFKYLLQTSTNGFSQKIVSTIFKDGNLLTSSDVVYQENLVEPALRQFTEQIHFKRRDEIKFTIELSRKFSQISNEKVAKLIGKVFLRKNFVDEAISCFKAFLKRNKQPDSIYCLLGQAFYRKKMYSPAIKAFEDAVALKPQYADYHNFLGLARLDNNECGLAHTEFEEAIKINVYFAEAYYHQGLSYIKNLIVRDDYALNVEFESRTYEAFDNAVRMNPVYRNEQFLSGLKAFEVKDYKTAYNLLVQAQKKCKGSDPLEIVDEFYLKLIYQGETVNILSIWDYIKRLNSLVKKYPGYADLNNSAGIAYLILGSYFQRESSRFFERALQQNPDFLFAKKNARIVEYENRGLKIMIDSLLDLQSDPKSDRAKGLTIEFF